MGEQVQADTGRTCIEPGCTEPAGTPWSPYWCAKHDEERRARISAALAQLLGQRTEEEG